MKIAESSKRLSLHPLSFTEAVANILKVKPEPKPPKKQRVRKRGKNSHPSST